MKVLVTGATGFVGRNLVRRLSDEGLEVRALVRPATEATELAAAGVEIVRADLADGQPPDRAVRGCDHVYHLAAAHGRGATAAACNAVNIHGTERLALAASRAGVARFVLASTRGVHGSVSHATIDENTPASPDTIYRESKLRGERIVEACSKAHGLPYVTLRLPSMIGAGAMGWLGLFRAVAAGGFRVIGSGKNRQHPCHIDDAVEALVRAGATKGVEGETFMIGGTESISTRAFLERIAAVLGVSLSRVHLPAAPYVAARTLVAAAARLRRKLPENTRNEMFIASYVIDDSKARRLLGYAPAGPLDDALRQTAAWYRANGHL